MSSLVERFTLERNRWYAMTMYPGYGLGPYCSPVRIEGLKKLGDRTFDLQFFNAGYATGVQDFRTRFRTLKRTKTFLFAEEADNPDRAYVFELLNEHWLKSHWPDIPSPFTSGQFDAREFCRLLGISHAEYGDFDEDTSR